MSVEVLRAPLSSLDQVPAAMVLVCRGLVVYANRLARAAAGYEAFDERAMRGTPGIELVPEPWREEVAGFCRSVREGYVAHEVRLPLVDARGRAWLCMASARPVCWMGVRSLLLTITPMRQLREGEEVAVGAPVEERDCFPPYPRPGREQRVSELRRVFSALVALGVALGLTG